MHLVYNFYRFLWLKRFGFKTLKDEQTSHAVCFYEELVAVFAFQHDPDEQEKNNSTFLMQRV